MGCVGPWVEKDCCFPRGRLWRWKVKRGPDGLLDKEIGITRSRGLFCIIRSRGLSVQLAPGRRGRLPHTILCPLSVLGDAATYQGPLNGASLTVMGGGLLCLGCKSQEKRGKSHTYNPKTARFKKKAKERSLRGSGQHQHRSPSDEEEEDESVPASYHTVSLQVSQDVSIAWISSSPFPAVGCP